ncbi:MAG: TPM domain-containing protein [Bacteroidota bacterium]|jgi:uncharacterized protein
MHNHIPLNRTIKKLAYTFKVLLLTASTFLLGINTLYAKDIPAKPNALVNDYANILTGNEKQALEQKLLNYEDSTSTQITIVIEQSLDGDDLFDYCQRLAESWGIGVKGKNNGILIYVAIGDRKSRIHTGYGMEATITDALSTRIRTTQMNPAFKEGRFYDGLDAATTSIMKAASGEFVNDGNDKPMKGIPRGLIIIIVIIILLIFTSKGKGGRGMRGNRGFGGGPVFWGGTFGSGGFSSGGGGGFGGFGGGGFGGGGSGGSW